jgi:hypothetical protein
VNDDCGVYEEHEIEMKGNGEFEIPFAMAKDDHEHKDFSEKIIEEIKHSKDKSDNVLNKSKGSEKRLSVPKDNTGKRGNSVGNTPTRPNARRKKTAPENIKNKLKTLSRLGSVIRNYSADRFRDSPTHIAANSIERLKQNLDKFKKNTMFKKGSESERSISAKDSKFSG